MLGHIEKFISLKIIIALIVTITIVVVIWLIVQPILIGDEFAMPTTPTATPQKIIPSAVTEPSRPRQAVLPASQLFTPNAAPARPESAASEPERAAGSAREKPKDTAPPPVSGDLGRLTELRSIFELREAELRVKEVEKKIADLGQPSAGVGLPSSPVVQAQGKAAPSVKEAAQLPMPTAPLTLLPVLPRVLSISGLDGNLTAVLSTHTGRKTVQPGSLVDGGRVERISTSTVIFKANNGNVHTLGVNE
jgi:type IV pilus biogenesis protein PilP